MKNFKRYWLVGILVIVAVSMGITKIRYRNVDWEPIYNQSIPTVTPTSAPQIDKDYPLWELLPYEGKNYTVDRYSEPGILVVKTLVLDKKIMTEEIYNWIMENKVATESHKLIFEKML